MLPSPQNITKTQTPREVLSAVFGYDEFRGEQEAIINDVIAGKSCGVLMPTGSGKSLCYQIPSICMNGTGIIVSPLIALMQDQVIALKELGVRAAAIHSGLEYPELRTAMNDLRDGNLDLVYVAPERLVNDEFLDILDNIPLALFAIDEAHCISQWGHDFRPEYRQISLLRTRYPNAPCIAVTATADEPTRKDIVERLALPKLYVAGFDRPNIMYNVAVKNNPRSQLARFLKARSDDASGIIYCLSRRKVEETAKWLADQGYNALPYHARPGLSTFGIGTEHNAKEWQSIIRQLVACGFLYVDMEAHGGLKITQEGADFLKEKQTIQLRLDPKVVGGSRSRNKTDVAASLADESDQALFADLKSLRLDIAKEHNVPPYVVFHDKTMIEMVIKKPTTLDQMAHIPGVGQSKLTKYGQIFLDALAGIPVSIEQRD